MTCEAVRSPIYQDKYLPKVEFGLQAYKEREVPDEPIAHHRSLRGG